MVRVAKEAGLTTDQIITGVANGELQGEASSSNGSAEAVVVDARGKGHLD